TVMKTIHLLVSAALATGMAAPALGGVDDPEVIIYRFSGVRDDGAVAGAGVATVIHCSNFSGATESLRFVLRGFDATIKKNTAIPIAHLNTLMAITHVTMAYPGIFVALATGAVFGGMATIAATSTNIVCTANTIDASTASPVGVPLRAIR